MNIGERVQTCRLDKGWSLSDLADRAGVKVKELRDLEQYGQTNIIVLRQIANALDCSLVWLVDGIEPGEAPVDRHSEQACGRLSDMIKLLGASQLSPPELRELQKYFESQASGLNYQMEGKKSSPEAAFFELDRVYQPVASFSALPISAKLRTVLTPADSSAANFSSAVPLPPEMIAPAWPMRLPGGAVTPAM